MSVNCRAGLNCAFHITWQQDMMPPHDMQQDANIGYYGNIGSGTGQQTSWPTGQSNLLGYIKPGMTPALLSGQFATKGMMQPAANVTTSGAGYLPGIASGSIQIQCISVTNNNVFVCLRCAKSPSVTPFTI